MAQDKKNAAENAAENNDMNEGNAGAGGSVNMTMAQFNELMTSMVREMKNLTVKAVDQKTVTRRVPAKQEKVKVKLFRDSGKYKDDVYVNLNGRRFMVPRGVEVEVPSGVAEILNNSMSQDEATEHYVRSKVDTWDAKVKEL